MASPLLLRTVGVLAVTLTCTIPAVTVATAAPNPGGPTGSTAANPGGPTGSTAANPGGPTGSTTAAPSTATKRVIPVAAGNYSWGTGFGVSGPMWRWKGYHTGVDFGASEGTSILAAADGVITSAGGGGGAYGNMTIQRISPTEELLYAHQSVILVKNGQQVKAGQIIGKVGSTGNSTGPHLHFELRVNGEPVDPRPWLNGASSASGYGNPTDSADFATGSSPALTQAAEEAQAAQTKNTEAAEILQKAELQRTKAVTTVNDTTLAESLAAKDADGARIILEKLVRASYMEGTSNETSTTLQAVLGGPEAIVDLSRADTIIDREGDIRGEKVLAAQTVAETAHTAAIAALKDFANSETHLADARVVAEKAAAKYAAAVNTYNLAAEAAGLSGLPAAGTQVTIGPDGCPVTVDAQWMRDGTTDGHAICVAAVAGAPTPEAALAIKYAFAQVGKPYACGGAGRMDAGRYDCSSLVSRAYKEAAGLTKIPGEGTTVTMTRPVQPWLAKVSVDAIRPGDLVFYAQSGTSGDGSAGHVVMALGNGKMIDTGACGDGVRIQELETNPSWTQFDGAFRVLPQYARLT